MAEPGCLNDAHVQHLQVRGNTILGNVNMKQKVNNTLLSNSTGVASTITLQKEMSGTIFTAPITAPQTAITVNLPTVDTDSMGEKYTFIVDTTNNTTPRGDLTITIPGKVGMTHRILNHTTRSVAFAGYTDAIANANRVTAIVVAAGAGANLTATLTTPTVGTVLSITCVSATTTTSLWLLEGTARNVAQSAAVLVVA